MNTYIQIKEKETLSHLKGIKSALIIIAFLLAFNYVEAQNFNRQTNINLQISTDTTLYPFDGYNVTSIGVSGQVTFTSELGFIRFVVSDTNGDDYLVYESYRLFEEDSIVSFTQKCEESCFYETFVPTEFVIQVKDAIVNINSVDLSSTHYSNAEYLRLDAATTANNNRLVKVQSFISQQGLIWAANHTKLSDLSFASRAKLWGRNYKSYGYEYYAGGIYCLERPQGGHLNGNDYVASFDWRNRHGANDPNSSYYDGDVNGTGWLSPITCQLGCWEDGVLSCGNQSECTGEWRSLGTCWSFSATAHVEALANLYYNEHLDLDLSEQYPACQEFNINHWEEIHSWHTERAFYHYQNGGVPYESCWPYTAGLDGCEPLCSEPMERVSIDSYIKHDCIGAEELRHLIIERGPVAAAKDMAPEWDFHSMLLAGWGTIDEDSPAATGLPGLVIPDDWYGLTYWIFKNSYGVSNDFNMFDGYSYILPSQSHTYLTPKEVFEISGPVNVPGLSTNDIRCEDKDGDGYYNWGIGPKPVHCPPCPDEPDGDDNNPSLGPVNDKGQCTIINTYNSSFEHGWDDWIQITYTNNNHQEDFDWWRHSGPTGHYSNPGHTTGPQQAQEGDYYIYVKGSAPWFYEDYAVIQSPPIDFSGLDACDYVIDFYYHMNAYYFGSHDRNELRCVFYREGNICGIQKITNNQGEEWKHAIYKLPEGTDQIRFYAQHGRDACDIAIDNITIGPWNHDETPIVITDNTVWEESDIFNQDIIIESGGKLIIRKTGSQQVKVEMHPESKIIVKPGGQLILDGCKLSCYCKREQWQGIQVWGDNTKDQKKHNGVYYQGYLEMKNGATIQDAICAVELWNPNHWSTTGGIILANNATFNNNAKAIHALNYQYIQNGRIADYNARFTECTFKISPSYHNVVPFYKHADLANVQGVRFSGCSFWIEEGVENISDWTIGIAAYNAGFTVDATYNMQVNNTSIKKRSLFWGFHKAIQSEEVGIMSVPKFTVKHSDFRNNDYGIYSRKGDFATILDCNFELGLDNWYSCNAGVFLDNTSGFAIEENSFTKGSLAVDDNFGIVVKDSKSQNQIYHNHFDGLYCANLAIGVNNNGGHRDQIFEGLGYGCNENVNNDIDFYVMGTAPLSGIQSQQGNEIATTRNTFSQNAYHFYNGGAYRVTYYYYDTPEASNEHPVRYNEDKFRIEPSGQTEGCPQHYGGGDNGGDTPVLPPQRKTQLEQDYYNAFTTYSLIKNVYERHVDGGSTNNTLADIKSARPSDMWQLRSRLLGSSPYLSQNVLFAAADRDDVFTESVLFEIMLSNPDELKKDTLIHYLENKTHPLPGYMISVLEQVANGTSAKTVLQNQMASYRKKFSLAAGDMVRSILNDTVVDMAELRGWLGNMNDISADRNIIAAYMSEGDFANAFALAGILPSLYGLEGATLQDHNDYMSLLNLYQNLYNNNRNTMQLNETELALVETIADNGVGASKAMAQALLEGAYDYHYENCPIVPYPEGGKGRPSGYVSPPDIGKALGFTATVKPNPTSSWASIDYSLPADYKTAVVEVTNMLGDRVHQMQLNGNEGQSVIDLRGLADGVYTVTIMCGGYFLTEKLVVSK